jgi:hypothetical protein
MGAFEVFLIRVVLAGLFSVLISRVFFRGTSVIKISALAVALLGLAYLFEWLRKRDKGGGNES